MRNFLPLFFIIPVACFATGGTMAGIGTRTDASGLSKGRYLAVLRVDGKMVAKSGFVNVR